MSWLILLSDHVMARQNSRQVVADTLCTVPAADMAANMQNTTCSQREDVTSQPDSFMSLTHLAQFGLEVEAKD